MLKLRFWNLAFTTALLLIAASGMAQAKRVITHEDVWLMKRVGAPLPSPDGRWVVFSVVEPAYDEKEQVSDLWIVPSDGSAKPRRLTNSKGPESGVSWSPDGRRIAFTAKREGDEVAQIYILNILDGGEAMRSTNLSTGARSPQFSPDGKSILFQSIVFPGAQNDEDNKRIAAERKNRKYNARVYEGFPIRNWDRWMDDKQTHLFVQSLDAEAKPKDLLAPTKLVGGKGFAGATTSGGDDLQPVWTPDGKAIIFTAMDSQHASAFSNTHTRLYEVTVASSDILTITPDGWTDWRVSASRPRFSPDGGGLYFIAELSKDKEYNLDRLGRIPWPLREQHELGERTLRNVDFNILTTKFDRSIASFGFSPDGRTIFFTAEDAGHENIYSMPAAGGEPKPALTNTGVYSNLSIATKASTVMAFASWESAVSPAEIVQFTPGAKTHKALTAFNAERITAIDWQPLREFWFTSKRGARIHSFLALPAGFDENKKYPLVNFLHGGPHSMTRDQFFIRWNYHLLASPGYVILMTDYTGSTGYGEKFSQAIQLDPLKGPGEELNEAADEAIKQFKFIDASRQAAGGASYGGHLANWLQATTTRYKCLFSHAGLINLESQWGTSDVIFSREVNNGGPVWEQGPVWREQNPIRYAAKFKTPMLITVGENDFRVPLNNSLESWSIHQRLRIPSKLIVFPEENHWILKGENSRFFYSEVLGWLKRWL